MSTAIASFRSPKPNSRHSSNAARHRSAPPDPTLSSSGLGRSQRLDPTVHLSPDRKAAMLQMMRDSERDVLHSIHHEAWKLRMSQNGISYYVDDSVGKGFTRFCCVGLTDAPVADIMKMFLVSDTETLLKNVRIMYRNVKEARILSVLKRANAFTPHQSVYIRYASFDTPTLMNGRDICVCVSTNLIERDDGSTIGYCLWESVDIPECPDRFDADKIIRSRMRRSGFVLRNSGKPNALTKIRYIIGVEIGGFAPRLMGRIYMTIFGGNCRRVCQHYRKRSLDPETFKSRENWAAKGDVKNCPICARRFGPFVKRYNCVKCGQAVSGHCSRMEDVSVRGAVVTSVRICYWCLDQAGMLKTHSRAIAARDSVDSAKSEGADTRDLFSASSGSTTFCWSA
ncbi:hypothetical protein PF005_g20569 [Phytophthora fragariae]|uniref:FYVE-type domain-containing protein n=1 Tax=Phytophthora fragariae TaxID=53985 RepID=A0A6A3E8N4_9STRA|nr:hypothetical protein PF003_g6410 [Phytophthora fragariae]KAE8928241.1 hypothetical protein PF009_g21610 [Phytophthora fragariae]KAE8988027.1 hypothetical protein PF011_g19335 [Phytophthora fragariae]KAE9086786.1 hypothetical protein PF007_g20636 [Phytophthora fragariae]KAE9088161.1 hypothetical protein PF010_g19469 [Phytophthora fragariae]